MCVHTHAHSRSGRSKGLGGWEGEAGEVVCGLASHFDLNIALAVQGLLRFSTNFTIIFPISVKNAIGILIGANS